MDRGHGSGGGIWFSSAEPGQPVIPTAVSGFGIPPVSKVSPAQAEQLLQTYRASFDQFRTARRLADPRLLLPTLWAATHALRQLAGAAVRPTGNARWCWPAGTPSWPGGWPKRRAMTSGRCGGPTLPSIWPRPAVTACSAPMRACGARWSRCTAATSSGRLSTRGRPSREPTFP